MRFIKPHDVVLADTPRSLCMAEGREGGHTSEQEPRIPERVGRDCPEGSRSTGVWGTEERTVESSSDGETPCLSWSGSGPLI